MAGGGPRAPPARGVARGARGAARRQALCCLLLAVPPPPSLCPSARRARPRPPAALTPRPVRYQLLRARPARCRLARALALERRRTCWRRAARWARRPARRGGRGVLRVAGGTVCEPGAGGGHAGAVEVPRRGARGGPSALLAGAVGCRDQWPGRVGAAAAGARARRHHEGRRPARCALVARAARIRRVARGRCRRVHGCVGAACGLAALRPGPVRPSPPVSTCVLCVALCGCLCAMPPLTRAPSAAAFGSSDVRLTRCAASPPPAWRCGGAPSHSPWAHTLASSECAPLLCRRASWRRLRGGFRWGARLCFFQSLPYTRGVSQRD
jgi:hypothetical protein